MPVPHSLDVAGDGYNHSLYGLGLKSSIRDVCTPQPGKSCFDTMRYRRSETEKDQENFRAKSINYLKIQIMFKQKENVYKGIER